MKQALRILIVDDEEVDRKMLKRNLAETALEFVTHETSTAEDCLRLLQLTRVDCVILDYRLPEMNGIDFLRRLKNSDRKRAPAVVMMSGSGSERLVVQAMRLGVHDYLVKEDISPETLEEAVRHAVAQNLEERQAEAESRRLEELALVDPLTGVGNRNLFYMRLTHALSRAGRQGEPIGLLYLDLNRFKEINDTYGHPVGDAVLQEVARRLTATARDCDSVVRLGGDEFAVIMETGVSAAGSLSLAQRIKDAVRSPVSAAGQQLAIDVSVGIAHFPEDADNTEGLVRAADSAMYEAKFGGRLDWDVKFRGTAT